MSGVRNAVVKRASEKIVAKYYMKLDNDFHHNKLVIKDVAQIQSKRLRNQVAGFVTKLYSRINKGNVKKIFIKKHEEERERRENMLPSKSIMDVEKILVDETTLQMIKEYGFQGNYLTYNEDE